MSTYREDLDALVQSAGFVVLKNQARSQWGATAYNAKINQAIARSQTDEKFNLAQELVKLAAIQTEVNALLSWPQSELDKMDAQVARDAEPASMMRGGR